MSESKNIGIDLGTTFSCCGTFKSNRVEIITYNDCNHTIPSHVFFDPENENVVVGSAVKFNTRSIDNTVYDSKRFIGKKYNQIKSEIKNWPFTVVKDDDNKSDNEASPMILMKHNKRDIRMSAADISKEILKAIKKTADEYMGKNLNEKTKAVITVPAYFNHQQRIDTKIAAEKANLEVISIINEPTAAAIAYAYQRLHSTIAPTKKDPMLLIYDFGGGTFDVSIIKINFEKQEVRVLATDGNSHLGGEDVDENLVNYFVDKYCSKNHKNLSDIKKKTLIQLRKECEKGKCLLSSVGTEVIFIDSRLISEEDSTLTLEKFNNINNGGKVKLFNKTFEIVDNVLKDAGLKESQIDGVVLVGGSSRIKLVKEMIKIKFPDADLCEDINTDEVVAYGATIVANMDNFRFKVFDVVCHTLSTDIETDYCYEMIKRNTPTPCHFTQKFGNYEDNQKFMDVTVYEGEGERDKDDPKKMLINNNVVKLGYFKLDNLPYPNKEREVIVSITYDVNAEGFLSVTAEGQRANSSIKNTLSVSLTT